MNMTPIIARRLRGSRLATTTNKLAVPNNNRPMTAKSAGFQLTSGEICIATRGTSKTAAVPHAIQAKTLFRDITSVVSCFILGKQAIGR